MSAIHALLERQLTRHGILDLSSPPTPDEWYRFLERISQTYAEADQDRSRLERQNRQLERVHALSRSTVERAARLIQSGAEPQALLPLLTTLQAEFERIDPQTGDPA